MQQLATELEIDFQSEKYKDAYSRINAIVIEGEQEAYENYITLGEMLPELKDQLIRLSKMESRHKKGFEACGRNLAVTPDMEFAKEFFAKLHHNFQTAAAEGKIVTCLLIQSLIIECLVERKLRRIQSRIRSSQSPKPTHCLANAQPSRKGCPQFSNGKRSFSRRFHDSVW